MAFEDKLMQGFRYDVTFLLGGVVPSPVKSRFRKVSGLQVSIETESAVGGFRNLANLQIPRKINYNNISLERGLIEGEFLNAEFTQVLNAFVLIPSDVLISVLDVEGEPKNSWLLMGAYPVRWSLSDFDANSSELLIETIELTYAQMISMSL